MNILFCPGSPAALDTLPSFIEALGDSASVFRPPGYDDSPPPDGDRFRARCEALARRLRSLPQQTAVVGFSAGAVDVLHALEAGAEPTSAILFAPALGPSDEEARAGYRALAEQVRGDGLPSGLLATLMLSERFRTSSPEIVAQVESVTDGVAECLAQEMDDYARLDDLTPLVEKHAHRISFLVPELDAAIDPAPTIDLANRLGRACHVLPGLGHMAYLEDAVAVARATRSLLQE